MTKPVIQSIIIADRSLSVGESTQVVFTFNLEVDFRDLFNRGGITAPNATLDYSSIKTSGASRNIFTVTLTPTDNLDSGVGRITVDLSLARSVADDHLPEQGVGTAQSAEYTVDTRRPTATVTLTDSNLAAGETTTVTFAFSEPVTGFDAQDIVLTNANGALGALTRTSGTNTWTATFTPTANVNDTTNTISVNLAGVTDAAGNAGTGQATSGNYTVDTVRPTATVTLTDSNLAVGETTTVTFAFSEPVTGFDPQDIVLTNANGTLGALTRTSGTNTWTATFTPTATVNDTTNTISVNLAGVTDAAGNTGTGQATSGNYTVGTSPRDPVASPAPTSTPAASPAPSPIDRDGDGIPGIVENKAPGISAPNGPAPMRGDGNGDGIKDNTQSAVLSASVATSPTKASDSADLPGSFMTLVAGSQDGKLIPGSAARLGSFVQKDAPADLPKGMEIPIGLIEFKATPTAGQGSEAFSLYVDPALGVNGYWIKDSAGIWVNLASEPYGGNMVTEGDRLRLDFKIDDGGQFDADGKVDGTITVAGAAAHMPLSIVGQPPDIAPLNFWF